MNQQEPKQIKVDKKRQKEQEKARKAKERHIRTLTDYFVKTVLSKTEWTYLNRKILRNLIRKCVGNKQVSLVYRDLMARYNICVSN